MLSVGGLKSVDWVAEGRKVEGGAHELAFVFDAGASVAATGQALVASVCAVGPIWGMKLNTPTLTKTKAPAPMREPRRQAHGDTPAAQGFSTPR